MENKLKWANLQKGMCPKCDMIFNYDEIRPGSMVVCQSRNCSYRISYVKFIELQKGTKSSAYKQMTKYYKSVDRYKEKIKTGYKVAIDAQNAERESNLKRMKAKMKLSNGLLDTSLF